MFLVYYHHADIIQRREHGRTGADHDSRVAVPDPAPFVSTFSVRQARVKERELLAELRAQPSRQNWCQGYFRHEHERGSPVLQCLMHCSHINLSFPAAGYAVDEECGISMALNVGGDLIYSDLLLVIQVDGLRWSFRDVSERVSPDLARKDFDDPSLLESRYDRCGNIGSFQ